MEVIAKLNKYRQSPRKVRIVANLIRGIRANEAINQLEFVNKRAALPVKKLLSSAIANAVNNFSLKRENLYVKQIAVDCGSVIKRWMPRAFGRASEIRKRASRITIVLDEKIETREKGNQKKSKAKEAAKIKENVKVAQLAPRKTVEILPQKTRGAVKTLRGFAPKIFQRKAG